MFTVLFAAALAVQNPQKTDCSSAKAFDASWQPAVAAYNANKLDDARAIIDRLVADCGNSPYVASPRVMGAEIALRQNDPDRGAKLLAPMGAVPGGIFPLYQLVRIEIAIQRKDADEALKARTALFKVSGGGLTSAPIGGKLIETFTAGGATVTAYDARFKQDGFNRFMVFLVSPADPLAMPTSFMVTTDSIDLQPNSPTKAYFVDSYTCWNHSTVTIVPGPRDAPPDYDKIKPIIEKVLSGAQGPATSMAVGGGRACAWPQFIAPGIRTQAP